MSKLRWQIVLVALALLAIAILLLAQQPLLGGSGAEPAQGGMYIEGLVGSVGRLNPLLDDANPADQDVNRLLFGSLLRFDDRGNPQPDLAEVWGISLDGLQYNFKLREGLQWHDGQPLTTADIVFTIELMRSSELPIADDLRALWAGVEVNAFDDLHIQFLLPAPFAPFADQLTFGILPQHILGEMEPAAILNAPFNLDPVGSGPYRFDDLISEAGTVTGVVLQAWDGYYAGRPFIDQIIFQYYPTPTAALQAYRQGDVLGISYVGADILQEVLDDTSLSLFTSRLPRLGLLLFNLDNSSVPFFQEQEVRQALLQGINRQWIIDRFLGGQAFVADGPILPGSWAYNENVASVPYDSEAAIAQLRQLGYTIPAEGGQVRSRDGLALEFDLVHPEEPPYPQIAQSIRDDLAVLGVQVTLRAVPYEALLSDYLGSRNYQAALVDINLTNSPDPDPYPFWHQSGVTGGQNYSKWDDRRASEYLEQARVSVSQAQRLRLYRNFQTHFGFELPALPLYFPVYNYAISSQVRGVSIGPIYQSSDRFATITEWFLVTRSAAEEMDVAPVEEFGE
ncbi:MAG: peptide ABC transporter substrate-binding protein [Anaerolineales bacterium]|nr:peptide ABC transporter substrate-binding protein [Anaerolineales bacterium]